jgi:hypothetical protein
LHLVSLVIDFCGELTTVADGLTIGRDADLVLDENPYLHRRFVEFRHRELWWLCNVGSELALTISDPGGRFEAWLAPGMQAPLVMAETLVRFSAGPTSYELQLALDEPALTAIPEPEVFDGETTIGRVSLTPAQHLAILALAEPALVGGGRAELPTSAQAARRLGWQLSRFNRKLDNVCDKLSRAGIAGLRGDAGSLATQRKARLVEYAIGARIVTTDQLPLLDAAGADE